MKTRIFHKIYSMAKNLFQLVFVSSVIILTHQLLHLSNSQKWTLAQIQKDPLIEVVQTSSSQMKDLKKQFLIVRVIQIKQQFASSKMIRIQEKVNKIMRKHGLINNEDLFVMSNLRPVFLINSRKWSFSMIFAIAGEEAVVQDCYQQLTTIGIMRIKSISTINFLKQKILLIDAFNKAKAALTKIIQIFPKIQIQSIEKMDILGDSIKNQEIIKHQIKNECIGTDLSLVQSEFAQIEYKQLHQIQKNNIVISVIFRVGNPSIQVEQDSEQYQSDYSSQDYSEDSAY